MKIIDEKGRLFGKLNLIDLLVILLLLAAAFAAVWKLGGKKAASAIADTGRSVTYSVLIEDVPLPVAEFAQTQTGCPLVNNGKVLSATIQSAANGDILEGHTDLVLTIDADAVFSSNVYVVGTQDVRVGYEYIVKTSELELTGIISALEVKNG